MYQNNIYHFFYLFSIHSRWYRLHIRHIHIRHNLIQTTDCNDNIYQNGYTIHSMCCVIIGIYIHIHIYIYPYRHSSACIYIYMIIFGLVLIFFQNIWLNVTGDPLCSVIEWYIGKSTLVWAIIWCLQAAGHYTTPCWSSTWCRISPYLS